MKTFFTFSLLTFSAFSFAQSTETKISNSIAFSNVYENTSPSYISELAKNFECISKKYKIDLSEYSDFLTTDDFILKYGDPTFENISNHTFFYKILLTNYDQRETFYNKFKKCLKKENFIW